MDGWTDLKPMSIADINSKAYELLAPATAIVFEEVTGILTFHP